MGYLDEVADRKLYSLADFLIANIPSNRVEHYQSSVFSQIQAGVTGHANKIMEHLGFYPVRMQLDLLTQMENSSLYLSMIGLIFDAVLVTFVELCVMLLHSLLSLSVQEKTYEYGVMRMVGMNNRHIIKLICLQCALFVAPANLLAFVSSIPCLAILLKLLLGDDPELNLAPFPSGNSLAHAVTVGLLIPSLSAIGPILTAL